ncbi:MAG: TIM barrel protein [Thermoguttaceae bacterium]|nr:TIM barrel protein [Thermoguttaceae bacterium]MDW8077569.1 TIM barrel protein [Thermoguttaceae bacterium]
MPPKFSRRGFASLSVAAVFAAVEPFRSCRARALGTPTAETCCGGVPRYPVRLGGPIFNPPQDPEELAVAHRRLGYRAAYCPAVSLSDKERIRDISAAFSKHDVVIAEVGRWCNLMDPDPARRKENFDRVCEGLALADELGALCCVNIAGSFNEKVWFGPHPKNLSREFFDIAVENARRIIDTVKPKRAKFCYEMMGWAFPDSADSYKEMILAVGREAFGVHLDPCNLINSPQRFYDNTRVINECFDKLGPWIVSCHAKDVAWEVEMQIHFREVVIGTGVLDYRTYLRRLSELPQQPPLMMEHLAGPEEYERSKQHIFAVGKEIGISFE